jgi:hypothetical protein
MISSAVCKHPEQGHACLDESGSHTLVIVPARYRVRLRGRTMSVWAHDEAHAAQTAHEWLDYSDKAGIDPQAMVRVERIGDEPCRDDLLGTTEGLGPSYLALSATYARTYPSLLERAVERLVMCARRWTDRRRTKA